VDIVDGTPQLDLKPTCPGLIAWTGGASGWLAENLDRLKDARHDGRFMD
jgi:tRNA (adenine37-N6)-methyltransferase